MSLLRPAPAGPQPSGRAPGAPGGDSPLAACIHCGFCLPACPTYRLWGDEADSPRGRVYLMRLLESGEAAAADVAGHLDACLGCLACVDACPSGVRYEEALEEARAHLERDLRRPAPERWLRAVVLALFPHPGRLRVATAAGLLARRAGLTRLLRRSPLGRRLPRLAALDDLLPDLPLAGVLRPRRPARRGSPQLAPPSAPPDAPSSLPRPRVAVLDGCVQQVLFADVNAATARVLAADGCEVVRPAGQGCCGALHLHAGRTGEAKAAARALIDAFAPAAGAAPYDAVAVNAAGCGSAMRGYGRLLAGDPAYAGRAAAFAASVRDVHEVLADLPSGAIRHRLDVRVAYHDACHLSHGQGVRAEPRRLLAAVPGLELVEVAPSDTCCGSAGLYNLLQPAAADELGAEKAAAVRRTAATVVAAANPGCLLQLRRHLGPDVVAVHPVTVLDASIRGLGAGSLSGR